MAQTTRLVSSGPVLVISVLLRLEPLLLLSPFQHVEWLGSWLKRWWWRCVVVVAVFLMLVEEVEEVVVAKTKH